MNMNRSQSNFSRALAKQIKKSTGFKSRPSLELRTVWKFRDTHKESKKMTTSVLLQPVKAQTQQQQVNQVYESAAQQEMKEFIKMMKKNSDESTQISNVPVQQPRIINTSQSSRSMRSTTKSLCQSRISYDVGQDQSACVRFDLDDLEKKIQLAISNKLSKKCYSSVGFPLSSRTQEDELDLQLKGLIAQLRKYNHKEDKPDYSDQAIDEDIKEINKKIRIIEKAIASSYTEHEMIKKVFSAVKKSNKKYLIGLKQLPRSNLSCSKLSVSKSPPSIHYETTNMSSFVKPSTGCYVSNSPKKSPFLLNRQPLPRSIYQRQFLYYGIVHTYSSNSARLDHNLTCQIKNNENPSMLESQNRKTTYQHDYQAKGHHTQVDSRELDCRVDKFKNTNISFIPKKNVQEHDKNGITGLKKIKRKSQQSINYQCQMQTGSYLDQNDRQLNKIRNSMCCPAQSNNNKQNYKPTEAKICDSKIIKTEHQSQFQYKGGKNMFEPDFKEKTLRDLKYSFKVKYQV